MVVTANKQPPLGLTAEPLYTAVQEQRKDTLQTTWPTREHHTSLTGGIDPHMGKASHAGDTMGPPDAGSTGQPSNKP